MKARNLIAAGFAVGLILAVRPLRADERVIPPSISKIRPAGMERGTTATFTVEGRNLSPAKAVIFDAAGITAKVTEVTDVPEKISGPRAGVDLGAQVPLGKKQTAQMEVTVAKDVAPGIHRFRVQTPLGTSSMAVFDIGALPEVNAQKSADPEAPPQWVELPSTLVGTVSAPGAADRYEFQGKAGEALVFQVVASELGSDLESLLALSDSGGQVLAEAGNKEENPDAVLTAKLPADGKYTIAISDREKSGGPDHFYRLNAGALPYVTGAFPLGARAGQSSEVSVWGVNLGGVHAVHVWSDRPTTITEAVDTPGGKSLNTVKLAVDDEPEVTEQEPNDSPAQAQNVSLPVTINGHIDGGAKRGGTSDQDYFRFKATKGERLTIEVAASRLGSPLDSVIEVLDAEGNPIPRATIRCLNQTVTTLSDRDSRTEGIRFVSLSGFHVNDYVMIGDELDRIVAIPDQPDADVVVKGINGLREAFLGTSPDVHAVNTLIYRVEVLPPGADFPPNGLPVFRLTWRNDDGGPGYSADSRLDFVAPKDGEYILHLRDVRGLEGRDFAYRLTLKAASPDFQLSAYPENPNIPRGGSIPVTVSADRLLGYTGPITVEVKGLPRSITASHAEIPEGQDSTVVVLSAAPDAALDQPPARIQFVGVGRVNGHDLERVEDNPLQLASVIPAPDVVVTTEPTRIALEPGKEVRVKLHVERHNGFKGRVPCVVENLPPGVRVVNIGLNGVLVTEEQSTRTFTLRAEDWAKPIDQPIYVVAEVESNSPTRHASPALLLKVEDKQEAANTAGAREAGKEGASGRPPNR